MKEWQRPGLRRLPASSCLQVFADGSYTPGRGSAFGCVAWSPGGDLLGRWAGFDPHLAGSAQAEVGSALFALDCLADLEWQGAWRLSMDCLSAVSLLQGAVSARRSQLKEMVHRFSTAGGEVVVDYVPRSANRDAHQCANKAYRRPAIGKWMIKESDLTAAELDARQAWGIRARQLRLSKHPKLLSRSKSAAAS